MSQECWLKSSARAQPAMARTNGSSARQFLAFKRNVSAEVALVFSQLVKLAAKIVEHMHANSRRQVAAIALAIDFSDQGRQAGVFAGGNLAQAVPEFVFQRHAGFVSIKDDRTFNHCGLHDVPSRRQKITGLRR